MSGRKRGDGTIETRSVGFSLFCKGNSSSEERFIEIIEEGFIHWVVYSL